MNNDELNEDCFCFFLTLINWLNYSLCSVYWIDNNAYVFLCDWCLQSWLRVSQQFHTVNQVVVGAILESIFSILWSCSWDAIVLQAFISSFWI
jgi:hypothetical protein